MKTKSSLYVAFLILVGVVILLNVLFSSLHFRLDFTQDNRYTLSDATKNILKELDQPVTVTAYISEDLPPRIEKVRKRFKELLIEYSKVSGGNVMYEILNPNEDKSLEQKAIQNGIRPTQLGSGEKDRLTVQKAFLGAIIQMGQQKEAIPFIAPGVPMEYELSSKIKKVSVVDKPAIGILQGHGEPSRVEIPQVENSLSVLYELEHVRLNDSINQLNKYRTVAIVAPTDSFADYELQQLEQFLNEGNNLFLAINRVDGSLQNAMGRVVNTGLEQWLNQKGIILESNFLVDNVCQSVQVVRQSGNMRYATPLAMPYLPIFNNFADHPVTKGLETVVPFFASTIRFTGDTSKIDYQPIIMSSEKSGTEPAPTRFMLDRQWSFPMENLTAGIALEGKLGSAPDAKPSKMIVIADGDFPVSDNQRQQQLPEDNISLMANSIDWLSDVSGLMELRTKGVTSRPLEEIEEGRKTFLKYLNFLLPIFLIIIYGVIRMQRNRNLRIKRMEEGYV